MKVRITYRLIVGYLCFMVAGIVSPASALAQTEPCSAELIGSCKGSTDCSSSLSGGMMGIKNTGNSDIMCEVVYITSGSGSGGGFRSGYVATVSLSPGQSSMLIGWIDTPIGEIPFWEFQPIKRSGTSTAECYVTDNPESTCEAYEEWECSATCDPIPVSVDIKLSSIGLKGKGKLLPVVIMGADDFDATTVDPATIRLGREGVRYMATPLRWNCKGNDLGLKFDKSEVVNDLMLGDVAGQEVQLIMTGKLKNEFGKMPFMGAVDIWVLQ